jgi:hypothetical protein
MSIVSEIINDGGYTIVDNFIHPSQWVRTQVRITPRGGIIHWTGNISVGANDRANRNFFDGRKDSYGSAQIIGDMDSILGAIPYMPNDVELAYHVGANVYQTAHFGSYPNNCTIGYEMCVNKDGNFRESYKRAVWTMAYLGYIYKWNPREDVMRHHDITGKDCPLPFLDLIYDDSHCLGIGWSASDTKWMRDNLQIDGIQGEKLWIKYVNDVSDIQDNITKNNGILKALNPVKILSVPQEDEEDMKLTDDQWKRLGDSYAGLFEKKILVDSSWATKAYNKELTVGEIAWINTVIYARQLGVKV